MNLKDTLIFTVPGLYNSGTEHWQSYWEKEFGFTRIQQQNWESPACQDWIKVIDDTVSKYPLNKVILIGHSLACCTIVKWAAQYQRTIKAALLVAPSDVEASLIRRVLQDFHRCHHSDCHFLPW